MKTKKIKGKTVMKKTKLIQRTPRSVKRASVVKEADVDPNALRGKTPAYPVEKSKADTQRGDSAVAVWRAVRRLMRQDSMYTDTNSDPSGNIGRTVYTIDWTRKLSTVELNALETILRRA
jgi:hypothetical protein